MVVEGALHYFLETRVSYDGLEKMFNAVWEHKSLDTQFEYAEECMAREALLRFIDAIDEEGDDAGESKFSA